MRLQVLELLLPPLAHLLPWRQVEQVMANRGQNKWKLVKTRCFGGAGPEACPVPIQEV